ISLLDTPWLQGKKIIMLEPRRPAARMAAHRMAGLRGEKTGETVGYQVRFERKISQCTRIEVLTEGLLLKRLQADPELTDVGLVIFDEFHERNLVADLSLALCLDVCQSLRDDLRLLVMSASMDTAKLTGLLKAKNITAQGQLHPVAIHYANQDSQLSDAVDACVPLISHALQAVEGDVLVFLPGRGEINRLQAIAEEKWSDSIEVLTLFGELGTKEQDRVLNPESRKSRRLILSTDIAETSLTIEGLEAVVDSGRVRKPVFQANSGLTRLETRWVSRASALQRTGRAGRLGPGQCFRAWTESRQQRFDDWIVPEILQADLSTLVLELAAWGVTDPADLAWLDMPPKGHWQQAVELLQQLQALDAQGKITQQGQQMALLPMHPRLAHMLINASDEQSQRLAADIAALLSDRDPLLRVRGHTLPIDISLRLSVLSDWREHNKTSGADRNRLRQLDRLSVQFLKNKTSLPHNDDGMLSVGRCLALAYPDRIAKRRLQGNSYLMTNGKGVIIPEDDSLVNSEYLVIADLDAGKREGRAWLAASIDKTEIEQLFAVQINHQRITQWDDKNRKVVAREIHTLGEIRLAEKQVALQPQDQVTEVLLAQIRNQGLALFAGQDKFNSLRARIQTIRHHDSNADWPDVSDNALIEKLEEWLLPWLDNVDSLKQVNLFEALQAWLGWDKQQRLNQLLPATFQTPAGSQRKIEYDFNEAPLLKVPLQEMLGLSVSPTIAGGRINLVIHLLSPAGRPLQVTSDLAAFWKDAYQEVKKEMRGRYPKHYWPDDPASSEATRFTKKRMKK
ncbi:MAG: ATP-dependent helicase HrpB, partial [Gammaproteobacteria bacterium]|nr:ATP-dependent helicase HrpB [Gammaproteobacteria bacterium]